MNKSNQINREGSGTNPKPSLFLYFWEEILLIDGNATMTLWRSAGELCIHSCTLSRCPNCIDTEIKIISNLSDKLRF